MFREGAYNDIFSNIFFPEIERWVDKQKYVPHLFLNFSKWQKEGFHPYTKCIRMFYNFNKYSYWQTNRYMSP